jgi:hypothetical protein
VGYGEGVLVRRRLGLLGCLGVVDGERVLVRRRLDLLLGLEHEGEGRQGEKQEGAEEDDVSGRGLLRREDQAVALVGA